MDKGSNTSTGDGTSDSMEQLEESSAQAKDDSSPSRRGTSNNRRGHHHRHQQRHRQSTTITAPTMDSSSDRSCDGVLSMLRRRENTRECQELAEAKLGIHMHGTRQRQQLQVSRAITKNSKEESSTTAAASTTQQCGPATTVSSSAAKACQPSSLSSPDCPKPTQLSRQRDLVAAGLHQLPGAFAVTPTPSTRSIGSNISSSDDMCMDEEGPSISCSNHLLATMSFQSHCSTQRDHCPDSGSVHQQEADQSAINTTLSASIPGATTATRPDHPKKSHQLAVARLVHGDDDEDGEPVLGRAQEITNNDNFHKRRARDAAALGVLLFCLVLVGVAITGILLSGKNEEKTNPHLRTPSPSTTNTTLTTFDHQDILGILPIDTVQAIEYSPESPQSQAFDWLMQDPEILSLPLWRITQRFALATLFYATNGDDWFNNTDWLSYTVNECDWYASFMKLSNTGPKLNSGLLDPYWDIPVCNDEGVYQQLRLYGNKLQGSIPTEISLLTELETMALFINSLTGTLPLQAIAPAIKPLKILAMAVNQICGSLPTEVGLMSNLEGLGLLYNQLQGSIPSEMGLLENLFEIHLEENTLTGSLPTELGLLTNARKLHVDSNSMSGIIPTELGLLQDNIEDMLLFSNRFSGRIPSELGLLTHLGNLNLSENDLQGKIPVEMGSMTDLSYWSVAGNPQLSGKFPVQLCERADLELVFDCSQALCGCGDNEQCPCI